MIRLSSLFGWLPPEEAISSNSHLFAQFVSQLFPSDSGTDRPFRNRSRMRNKAGYWGEQAQLDRFLQMYAVEKATPGARRKGCTVTEQALRDGSIRLQISEGG